VAPATLHPRQIEVARRVFSPDPEEVRFAKRVIEAIPDGRGVHMIDGTMQTTRPGSDCRPRPPRASSGARATSNLKASIRTPTACVSPEPRLLTERP
jgi:malyl-CoA/(S)-citramalyl-CoA lyase